MTWQGALDSWILYLTTERRLGGNTLLAYRSDLERFIARVGSFCPAPAAMTAPTLLRGLGDGMDSPPAHGWAPGTDPDESHGATAARTTIQRRQSSLKSFCRFLIREGILPAALLSAFEPMGRHRSLPDHLTEGEWQLVMERFREHPDPRGALLFALLGGLGLRVSEAVTLRAVDYSAAEQVLRVRGKGEKTRYIPIPPWLLPLLQNALPALTGHGPQWLFPGRGGRALTRQQAWNLVKRHSLASGVMRPVHPHMLRHGFATRFLASGASLRVVQEFLGHADVRTTERYTHLNSDRLRRTVRDHHPFPT